MGDTHFVSPLGVSANEVVCHPRGWYVFSAQWSISVLRICRTHGWYIVSAPWGTKFNYLLRHLVGEPSIVGEPSKAGEPNAISEPIVVGEPLVVTCKWTKCNRWTCCLWWTGSPRCSITTLRRWHSTPWQLPPRRRGLVRLSSCANDIKLNANKTEVIWFGSHGLTWLNWTGLLHPGRPVSDPTVDGRPRPRCSSG